MKQIKNIALAGHNGSGKPRLQTLCFSKREQSIDWVKQLTELLSATLTQKR